MQDGPLDELTLCLLEPEKLSSGLDGASTDRGDSEMTITSGDDAIPLAEAGLLSGETSEMSSGDVDGPAGALSASG